MKKQLYLIGFVLLFAVAGLNAQERNCSSFELLQQRIEEFSLSSWVESYLDRIVSWMNDFPNDPQLHRNPVTIPVVVHIVQQTSDPQVTNAQVTEQIRILNEDYRKANTAEINRIPQAFRDVSANSYIQFALARRDPDGNATNGINRVTKSTTNQFTDVKENVKERSKGGADASDTDDYFNIWVCDVWAETNGTITDDLLGYATFPEDTVSIPGVVIDFESFGTSGTAQAPFNLGRTATHEVGHFFGLYHIWGDDIESPNNPANDCNGSDLIDDTPNQAADYGGCPPSGSSSCGSADMYMNFMDYVHDSCMCIFTIDQRARMLANLRPGGVRASLAVSNALFPPNVPSRNYTVELMPQMEDFPSWKASMAMLYGFARNMTPDIDQMVQQVSGDPRRLDPDVPEEISEVVYALGLEIEKIRACYSPTGFYTIINNSPVALISVHNGEKYGLVVNGMTYDPGTNLAYLHITDPMNVGPQEFFTEDQEGSNYRVNYARFMVDNLERLADEGADIYFVYIPYNPTEL